MAATKAKPKADSRTARLAEQIRYRIAAEQFADGDLFMTEAQLAKEYGVSRNIAREAVSQLRGLGILEGRKSKGLLVRRPNPVRLLSHSLTAIAQSEEDVRELAKLRYVVEQTFALLHQFKVRDARHHMQWRRGKYLYHTKVDHFRPQSHPITQGQDCAAKDYVR